MAEAPRQRISASTSVVLDVLRVLAALVVLVFHASSLWSADYPAVHARLGTASHAAVVVFFVISGYVIAFTTAAGTQGFRQYAVARLSRLYSMLVPALVVTAIVEGVVVHTNAALAERYVRSYSWVRYLLSAFFGNESGFWSAAPALNSPLWSLSYEFWYYTLFGIWFYRKGRRRNALWLLVAVVLAGPKILLMLPIWLFGVAAYRLPKHGFAPTQAWVLFGCLLGLAVGAGAGLPALPTAVGTKPLFMAGQFVTDWVVGALFAAAIWSLPAGAAAGRGAGIKYLRTIADLSFPLYVLHFPLLVLWRATLGGRPNDLQQLGQMIAGVSLIAALAGLLLKKQRTYWVRFFSWVSSILSKKADAQPAQRT